MRPLCMGCRPRLPEYSGADGTAPREFQRLTGGGCANLRWIAAHRLPPGVSLERGEDYSERYSMNTHVWGGGVNSISDAADAAATPTIARAFPAVVPMSTQTR